MMYMVKKPQPLKFLVFVAVVVAIVAYVAWEWHDVRGTTAAGSVAVMTSSEPGVSLPGEMLIDNEGASEPAASTPSEAVTAPIAAADGYFVEARLERERDRSEEGDRLQAIVDDPQSTATSRSQAEQQLMELARQADQEGAVESVLKAKGFGDAVLFLTNASATVVVEAQNLTEDDVARVVDAVTKITDVPANAINVVAKS